MVIFYLFLCLLWTIFLSRVNWLLLGKEFSVFAFVVNFILMPISIIIAIFQLYKHFEKPLKIKKNDKDKLKPNMGDYFDPENSDHLSAFYDLAINGVWPENFIPKGYYDTETGRKKILAKICNSWFEHKLGKSSNFNIYMN